LHLLPFASRLTNGINLLLSASAVKIFHADFTPIRITIIIYDYFRDESKRSYSEKCPRLALRAGFSISREVKNETPDRQYE